jgi:hypothetical protein
VAVSGWIIVDSGSRSENIPSEAPNVVSLELGTLAGYGVNEGNERDDYEMAGRWK